MNRSLSDSFFHGLVGFAASMDFINLAAQLITPSGGGYPLFFAILVYRNNVAALH
jgi:hypothetical protein